MNRDLSDPAPGTADTLARLFEAHNRSLHAFLMARIGNEQEVQEVSQEAYARLLQLDRPGAISFLRAYLFKTAAHIAIDRARQRLTRDRLDRTYADLDVGTTAGPDAHVGAAEELAIIEQALYELPVNYRRAFILRRYYDCSPEQIVRELKIGKRMVRHYIGRATLYCKLRIDGMPSEQALMQVLT